MLYEAESNALNSSGFGLSNLLVQTPKLLDSKGRVYWISLFLQPKYLTHCTSFIHDCSIEQTKSFPDSSFNALINL